MTCPLTAVPGQWGCEESVGGSLCPRRVNGSPAGQEPGSAGAGSSRRGSGRGRVNKTPPCIEMLIVRIVCYLRKVIWLLETPTKEASSCPSICRALRKMMNWAPNSRVMKSLSIPASPARCHAHRTEGSTAIQLSLGNPGGSVTCYLLLLAFRLFFFFPVILFFFPSPFSASALQLSHSGAHGSWVSRAPTALGSIPHFSWQRYFRLMQTWGSLAGAL